jgi:MFS transporter, ACS family, glucarate transporter
LFGYLASNFGYYLPVLFIGVMVMLGAFVWLKIDATQKIEFTASNK